MNVTTPNSFRTGPDENGLFGIYGGRFVAETLMPLVLDLEQSSVEGLFLKPKPKDCPNGQCNGLGKKPGQGKRPGKGDKPSKGAGMDGDIGDGW